MVFGVDALIGGIIGDDPAKSGRWAFVLTIQGNRAKRKNKNKKL